MFLCIAVSLSFLIFEVFFCKNLIFTKNALTRSIFIRFQLSFFLNWSEFSQLSIERACLLPACLVFQQRRFLCLAVYFAKNSLKKIKVKFHDKFSNFYKPFLKVTYKIAKFGQCLIYFHVKFEPDCSKIDGVMAIFVR